jgi:F0F1-type ATP synthase alpha subunit
MIIYAVTRKYLLSVPVEDVTRYEKELFAFIDTKYPEIPEAIASTKETLDQGERVKEVLKQPQYQPMPVQYQVMIIYAAINRYLADVGVHNVRDFEVGFYEFMGTQYPEVGAAIRESGQLSAESETKLKEAIEVYRTQFLKDLGFTGAAEIE